MKKHPPKACKGVQGVALKLTLMLCLFEITLTFGTDNIAVALDWLSVSNVGSSSSSSSS